MSNIKRVLVSLPDEFLKKVDDYAERNDYQRSELIRNAIRYYEKTQVKEK